MALRYLDSFMTYSTGQRSRRWPAETAPAATVTIAPFGLYNPNCLRITGSSTASAVGWVSRIFDDQATWCLGFRFKLSTFPSVANTATIAALLDTNGVQVDLRVDNSGRLSVTRNGAVLTGGTSTNTITVGVWYWIEWKCTISASISAGQCVVNVGGVQWLTVAAGQSTKAQTPATANSVRLGYITTGLWQAAPVLDYGDLYVCDGTGSVTGLVGDRKVVVRLPAGDGDSSQFIGTDGDSVNNWALVGEAVSDDDAGYVQNGAVGQLDLYAVSDHGGDITTIFALQLVHTWRKSTSGPRGVAALVQEGVGGPQAIASPVSLPDSWVQSISLWPTIPSSGAPWTVAAFDALQVGMRVTA